MSVMRTVRMSLVLPLGLVATLAACSSSSGPSSSPTTSPTTTLPTLATGSITCTNISGSLTFSPPLTTKGGSAESTAISLSAAACTTTGSNVTNVTGGSGSATITSATNSCAGLLSSRQLTIDMTWAPSTTRKSVVTFSGYGGATGPSGGEGFSLPDKGGTTKVTGSFAGSDGGASTTATAYSGESGTQLLTACGSSAGLPSIQVTSGSLNLK